MKAKRVLEIGTLGGYSTISLARAVLPDGEVITCELDQHHADVAKENLTRAGLAETVKIRVGPAMDSLKALISETVEPFDLVFIDADKENMPGYFSLSMRLSKPGTLLVFDNVVRDGEVADPDTQDGRVVGVRKLFDMLSKEPRVDATALQTVGAKGYDGFAFALVTS
jgi:predicted O-methyltransferase YrrM